MKKIILKSIVTLAAAFLIFNCSDPASSNTPNYVVNSQSFLYEADDADYLIDQATGIVTNAETGAVVGVADFATGRIIAADQVTVLAEGIVFAELEQLTPPVITSEAWVLSADETYIIYPNANVTDENGNAIGTFAFYTDPATGLQSSTGYIVNNMGETLVESVDLNTLKKFHATVNPTPGPTPQSSASVFPGPESSAGTLPGPESSETVNPPLSSEAVILSSESNPPPESSSATNVHSSSSSAKSSSSSAKSSSSSAKSSSSGADNSKCPQINVKGGNSGSGWATRYWDCCKPHCSVAENTSYHSKQCTNKGKSESTDWGAGSACNGGPMTACTSQIPFTIDGCSDMAFAFAAVPASNGGDCGKCFQLTFKGTGKYHGKGDGTTGDLNHRSIKGKKLIVMATNIGGDVQKGQFDIMIPGGGVGMFNGCSQMGWNIPSNSTQYGGLLSDCETELGYKLAEKKLYEKRKECLTEKCNSAFANDSEAKEGCLFLATWMEAAGNPMHDYVEVECPEVLKKRY